MSDKENQNVTIEEFFEFLKTYLDEKQIAFVKKAYDFAAKMHADQKRRSGEPYIIHPIYSSTTQGNVWRESSHAGRRRDQAGKN